MNDGDNGDGQPVLALLASAVLVLLFVEGLLLGTGSVLLVLGLPVFVRHAVDDFAGFRICDLDALLAWFIRSMFWTSVRS